MTDHMHSAVHSVNRFAVKVLTLFPFLWDSRAQ